MNEFKEAKQAYENTPIPAELDQRVRAGIRQGKAKRARRAWGKRLGTVAACFVVVVGALNVSPTMASAAADIPVLGGLFRVLTIRSYETEKDQVHYQVEVPEVDSSADIAQRVNAEIQQRVDEHVAEMEKMWTEYHEAFIATGGTEEEWAQRSMDVNVTYDIKSQTDTTVSFVVDLSQCSFYASQTQYYYNLDLENDRDITLRDLLGDDWVNICNTAIQARIDASVDADGFTYFFSPEEGGFTTVDERAHPFISGRTASPSWCSPNTPLPQAPWESWNLRSVSNMIRKGTRTVRFGSLCI